MAATQLTPQRQLDRSTAWDQQNGSGRGQQANAYGRRVQARAQQVGWRVLPGGQGNGGAAKEESAAGRAPRMLRDSAGAGVVGGARPLLVGRRAVERHALVASASVRTRTVTGGVYGARTATVRAQNSAPRGASAVEAASLTMRQAFQRALLLILGFLLVAGLGLGTGVLVRAAATGVNADVSTSTATIEAVSAEHPVQPR